MNMDIGLAVIISTHVSDISRRFGTKVTTIYVVMIK